LTHPQGIDAPLHIDAQRKKNSYSNNTLTIRTFLFSPPLSAPPCTANFCVSFSPGPPGDRGALHCRWNAIATQPIGLVSVQTHGSFYRGLKSKVGLAAATKAAALRIKLNIEGCGVVAPPMHAPSRASLLLPLLLSHNLPLPGVH